VKPPAPPIGESLPSRERGSKQGDRHGRIHNPPLLQPVAAIDLDTLGTAYVADGDIPDGVRKLMDLVREARALCGVA
jgi:hypothetical protein